MTNTHHPVALEHKGRLYIPKSFAGPVDHDELWFIANGMNVDKTVDQLFHLARINKAQRIGCGYPTNIEKQVQDVSKNLYVNKLTLR